MFNRAAHRIGGEAPQRAEGALAHGVAEVLDQLEVRRNLLAVQDLVHGLDAAHGADAAGGALAAAFRRAELEGEARLFGHLHGVVEHHDAAVADHPASRREGFEVKGRVEQGSREIGAQRAADLHRADRTARGRAAADVIDELAQCDAKRRLEHAAMLQVACKLDRHGAPRPSQPEVPERLSPMGEDVGNRRQGQHVVHNGWAAEQTLVRRQRRLGPHLSASALKALQQRRLLAADIGARAHPDLDVDPGPDGARLAQHLQRAVQHADGQRILGPHIDEAEPCSHRIGGDDQSLDQEERIGLHQQAVGEGAAVALVSVADDVFRLTLRRAHRLPLHPRREPSAAKAAKAGRLDDLDDLFRGQLQRRLQPRHPAVRGVVGEAQGVSDPGALEGQPRLAAEEGQGADVAEAQGMRAAVEQARGDQTLHIGRVHRAIADAARVRFHLDQRLQMEGAAGAVADDLDV